jgi:hypothetical protein
VLAVGPSSGQATTLVVRRLTGLESAPFTAVRDAPEVLVQRPAAAAPDVDVVLYLHGYDGCVEVLAGRGPTRCHPRARPVEGWDLLGAHAEVSAPSWLVMPQLAFMTRDGSPGRLARPGGARRLVDEVLRRAAPDGAPPPRVRSVVVAAHSAAFESAIAVVRHGGLDAVLRHVVLLDALYSGGPVFGEWVAADPGRSLVAFHTAGGTPERRARELVARIGRRLGDRLVAGENASEADVSPGRVVLARARTGHRGVPRRYLGPTLSRLLGAASSGR